MLFVDDAKGAFDASEFQHAINAGLRTGRKKGRVVLADAEAVTAAVTALNSFASKAARADNLDVIALYLQTSPYASELFSTLSVISLFVPIVLAGLDCLTAIVRYAYATENETPAILSARAVAKGIVKAHAAIIYNVFAAGRPKCSRKAIFLLQAVAVAHPLLAKEVVNRFDLTSQHFAPFLCGEGNILCRIPFLALVGTLIATRDFDILKYFSKRGRTVIISCITVISSRMKRELQIARYIQQRQSKTGMSRVQKLPLIMPSHVQRREIEAAIAFLRLFRNAFVLNPSTILRPIFVPSLLSLLSYISAAPMPPLSVSPRQVTKEQILLRRTARDTYLGIAANLDVPASSVVHALRAKGDIWSTSVTLSALRKYPRLSLPLLQASPFVTVTPSLSVSWLANVAVLSTALIRAQSPTTGLCESRVLDDALKHESSLVRHTGAMLTLAMTRLVEADSAAMADPQKFLPSPKIVRFYAQNASEGDLLANQLLATYQRIFDSSAEDDANRDLVYVALVASRFNYLAAEHAIRNALRASPRETVHDITGRFYLSGMIIQAARTSDKIEQSQLWSLCAHVIRQADLFPQGTLHDVDIILAVLSSLSRKRIKVCAKALEDIIQKAVALPLSFFDEIYATSSSKPNPCPQVSLLIAAIFFRFRKLCAGDLSLAESNDSLNLHDFFKTVLLAHVACNEVIKGHAFYGSYLSQSLPTLLDNDDVWWSPNKPIEKNTFEFCRREACNVVMPMLSNSATYPLTTYLASVYTLSQFHEVLGTCKANSLKSEEQLIGPFLGLVWNTVAKEKESLLQYDSQRDAGVVLFHNQSNQRPFHLNDTVGLLLTTLRVYPSEFHGEDGLKRLQQKLDEPSFTLLTCLILCTTRNKEAQRLSLNTIMGSLSLTTSSKFEKQPMYFVCQNSLIAALESGDFLRGTEIKCVIAFACDIITRSISLTDANESLTFSLKVIKALAFHSQHNICARARHVLSTKSLSNFPPLLFLTAEIANLLTLILPHFPNLRQHVSKEFHTWDVASAISFGSHLLPLISISLNDVVATECNDDIVVGKSNVFMLLLKNGHLFSSALPISEFDYYDKSAVDAIRQIGHWSNLSGGNVIRLLFRLSDPQSPFDNKSNTISLLWFYFIHLCETRYVETVSSTNEVIEIVIYLAQLIGNNLKEGHDLNLALPTTLHKMLLCVSKRVGIQNEELADLHSALAKPLNSAFGIFVLALSNWIKDSALLKKTKTARNRLEHPVFNALFQCLPIIMNLGVVQQHSIEFAIRRLSRERWTYLKSRVLDKTRAGSRKSLLLTGCEFLSAAITCLDRDNESDDIVLSLHSAREVLTGIKSFEASENELDSEILKSVIALDRYLSRQRNTNLNLSVKESKGLFQQKASTVLYLFSPQMLKNARDNVYNWGMERKLKFSPQHHITGFSEDQQSGTISEFVLRTFFGACVEALDVAESAVLDIEKVANNGILYVALTALSAPNKTARALGYACVEMFTRLVGPFEKVASESAAGLYYHRRQLAFLLNLLRNSCDEPLQEILPLFISWFIACLRVVLHPSNNAYNIVTSLFLRGPVMDVTDCVGLFHLFNCKGIGVEIKAAWYVGLESLLYGVRTARDVIILRRRKMLDTLFMYAGPSGFDMGVRLHALKVLELLVKRNDRIQLTAELCNTYGIVTWLANDDRVEHRSENVQMLKFSLLRQVVEHSSAKDAKRLAYAVTDAFDALVEQTLTAISPFDKDHRLFQTIVRCGVVITAAYPSRLTLFNFNFDKFCTEDVGTELSAQQCDIVRLISFQRNVFVTDATLRAVLHVRVQGVESGYFDLNNNFDLEHVIHLDAFIARCLIARLRNICRSRTDFSLEIRDLMARALQDVPSVWLAIAALAHLTLFGHISSEIEEVAAFVPANPPEEVSIDVMAQFNTALKNAISRLISGLLSEKS